MLVSLAFMSAALIAAGVVLLGLGVRGRLVDDHPVCRACRFDLVGLYPGAAACPECGGELRIDAMRFGRRKLSPIMLSAAAALCLLGAPGAGFGVWAKSTDTNWYALLPVEVLAWELRWSNDPSRAALEAFSRLKVGQLSGSDFAMLADALRNRPRGRAALRGQIDPAYGYLIETMVSGGYLEEAPR